MEQIIIDDILKEVEQKIKVVIFDVINVFGGHSFTKTFLLETNKGKFILKVKKKVLLRMNI